MNKRTFPLIGIAALALFASVFSNHSYSQAAPLPTPLAPKISAIESVKKTSKTYDLRISVSVNKGSSKLPIISTLITANNKSCKILSGKQSCTITGMPMRTQVTIRGVSRNKNGTGASSSSIRYTVGSARWSIAPSTTQPTSTSTTVVSTARAYSKFIPSSYSKDTSLPLVVLLHGYGATGALQESYMKFESVAEKNRFILVYPDGTIDSSGRRFWNATDACCDFASAVADDVYLLSILKEMESNYSVDPKRIYFVGHSNGGFMSYRMACKYPDRIEPLPVSPALPFSRQPIVEPKVLSAFYKFMAQKMKRFFMRVARFSAPRTQVRLLLQLNGRLLINAHKAPSPVLQNLT